MFKQRYTISSLLENQDMLYDKKNFIFFWKAFNQNVNSQCFSQWYLSDFEVDGVIYNCAEKFMMAEKARIFKCEDVRQKILKENNPKKIKDLGREVRNFQENVWKEHRFDVVVRGNINKFSQNSALKDYILSTENKILVEASPMDKIWGIGMDASNPNVTDPEMWRGKNLLGFALMEVRDILRKDY